ncbi:MAG: hypothetical protein KDA96_26565, partial [Planctomycetaceae bacterium]|nr:hypothetical protein [Planctomycetaceae bacterium]
RAYALIPRIDAGQKELQSMAESPEKDKLRDDLRVLRSNAGHYLQLALDLKVSETNPKSIAQARYLLSFVYLSEGRYFDAVVISRFCMNFDRAANPDAALDATAIAMAAATVAFNQAPDNDRDFETRLVRDVCEDILKWYPNSARGNEARLRLGKAYIDLRKPLQGVPWFLEVPESDPSYISARIGAGQAYWTAWVNNANLPRDEEPEVVHSPDEIRKWREEAKQLLQAGCDLWRTQVGPETPPTVEIVQAEYWLAQINNLDGVFQQTIDRLTANDAASVMAAIAVAEGAQRPEKGIRSPTMAGSIYRTLLRAYVGTQQIDKAMETMPLVESTGGHDITAVYTTLGLELQEELSRLKDAGDAQRVTDVRQSFEIFLQKVYERRDPSDSNQLIWIGETYFGLGSGVGDDDAVAADYFTRASNAYSELLASSTLDEGMRPVVNLRLARCLRHQGQFEDSLKLLTEILTANQLQIDAQFEAASLFTDWGAKQNDAARQLEAVQGLSGADGKTLMWGWTGISNRLMTRVRENPTPELVSLLLDARIQLAKARIRFADALSGDAAQREKMLQAASAELSTFPRAYRDIDDETWKR